MNLVVDTNIVFSTLLNPNSAIGEILMNLQDEFTFYAPDLLKEELQRYSAKIATYSKLSETDLSNIQTLVLSSINFISEDLISHESWEKAFALTKNIDEDDTPFVALSIELNTKLWTGDKILLKGLTQKGSSIALTTADIRRLIK